MSSCVKGYEQRWELQSVKHLSTRILLCTLFTLGTRWRCRRVEGWTIILVVHQKWRKKRAPEVRAPIGQVTQNLEWGVSVGYRERNNVALCASGAEKTNRFPWKEIMFGLHLRRPHNADQSHFCCVRWRGGGRGGRGAGGSVERIWTAKYSCTIKHAQHCQAESWSAMLHTNTLPSNSNTLWFKTKSTPVFCVLCLSWDNMAIWSGFQAAYRPRTTLAGWRTGCRLLSTRGGRPVIQCQGRSLHHAKGGRAREKEKVVSCYRFWTACNFCFKAIICQTLLSGRSFFNLPVLHKHWEKGF